jgi:hypothetical protein
MPAARS